jgi:hypothetical protein
MTTPKVFVSHASEDKARFVLPFATVLRQNGVDAWVDQWEMRPGDSLVDTIAHAITDAHGLIIVLSKYSIDKSWVREELNAAIVQRINTNFKIIPVVLDQCDVPVLLRSILYVAVSDVQEYERAAHQVINALFAHSAKPPLGPAPSTSLPTTAAPAPAPAEPHETFQFVDVATLHTLINVQQKNLSILLKQKMLYGEASVPLHIIHQLDSTLAEIQALKQELQRRG